MGIIKSNKHQGCGNMCGDLFQDFGIGYVGCEHADHLMSALKMYYEYITKYWEGKLYCGITMK